MFRRILANYMRGNLIVAYEACQRTGLHCDRSSFEIPDLFMTTSEIHPD